MIAEKNPDLQFASTIKGQKIGMSFDENSLVHIMSILTDLYSDPELAVIREYSTNAYDAHVEAGISQPIEVTLPLPLSPFFKIKDYGVGLSGSDIENIYSKYGASTKRETNDQVGMLGLGCKSALTYATQFTMVGIKDGQRVTVAISRDEDGAGSMTIVEATETTERNGVEIVIPVKRENSFEQKAREFFKYWQPGTVLINGQEPERLDGLKISDTMYVVKRDNYDAYSDRAAPPDKIVMGNVAYPANIGTQLSPIYSLVCFVEIGAVNFTPDRESLQDTSKTRDCIREQVEAFQKNIVNAVSESIDKAQNEIEALQAYIDGQEILPYNLRHNVNLTYKGKPIPEKYEVDPGADGNHIKYVPAHSYVLSRCTETLSVSSGAFAQTAWFYGYKPTKFTPTHKKKINKWASDNGYSFKSYALLRDKPKSEWIDPSTIFDWADIHAIKLPTTTRGGATVNGVARIPGSYDMWIDGSFQKGVAAADIDQTKPVFYLAGNHYEARSYANLFDLHHSDFTLVVMPRNRVDKFKRTFPKATLAKDEAERLATAWQKGLSRTDREALAMSDQYGHESFMELDPTQVKDPEIRRACKLAKKDLTKLNDSYMLFSVAGIDLDIGGRWKNPLDKYPLFDSYDFRRYPKDMYIYLNAAFAAKEA